MSCYLYLHVKLLGISFHWTVSRHILKFAVFLPALSLPPSFHFCCNDLFTIFITKKIVLYANIPIFLLFRKTYLYWPKIKAYGIKWATLHSQVGLLYQKFPLLSSCWGTEIYSSNILSFMKWNIPEPWPIWEFPSLIPVICDSKLGTREELSE